MTIYTLGFAGKTAEVFFGIIRAHEIRRLVDVRIHNTSQLAGFAKKENLGWFLRRLCECDYEHELSLAPSWELFDDIKKSRIDWQVYQRRYRELIKSRQIELSLNKLSFKKRTVLLCTEPTADNCHRRLAVEYLQSKWPEVQAKHL